MLYFNSDYMEGCHPLILEALTKTNLEKTPGYGDDFYTKSAMEKIKKACGVDDAVVEFLIGGTQTNATVIDAILKSYEGVISADTGHVNAHEAGAIEYTGHKVLALSGHEGKLKADDVDAYVTSFFADESYEHMVMPGMVYISHPTEYGTLYTKKELEDLSQVCKKHNLPLFLDGARLGYGLAADDTDVTLKDVASLCDVFYIGGTKVGALFGEAVVFTNTSLAKHFFTIKKQHGALLAKGRILGIQFDTLFTNDLYLEISKNAINQANLLKEGLKEKGYSFYIDSPTNQIFVILSKEMCKSLSEHVSFSLWEEYDENHMVIRFATSFATTKEQILDLLSYL